MNTPEIPNGLLERCLDTIPETATVQRPSPRLLPDAVSRRRLAWLVAAAAVPVSSVLMILPISKWLANIKAESRQSVAPNSDPDFVCLEQWTMSVTPVLRGNTKEYRRSPKTYRIHLMQKDKGSAVWQTESDFRTPFLAGSFSFIMLPSGEWFARTGKDAKELWHKKVADPNAFERSKKWITQDIVTNEKHKAIIPGSQKTSASTWKGMAVNKIEYTFSLGQESGFRKGEAQTHVEYFVNQDTKQILGDRRWLIIPKTGETIQTEETSYQYTPSFNTTPYFDVKNLSKGATVRL